MRDESQIVRPVASVIIITRNRPQMLSDCLAHLARQTFTDFEIVVVDSSSDDETEALMGSWPHARYVRIRGARNNMPQARNVGIAHSLGDIIAFIDDDSMVSPGWLTHLVSGYDAPEVGAVGGHISDPGMLTPGEERIGLVLPDGRLIQNFSYLPEEPRDVHWLRGCNMSFRCQALEATAGFDPRFTGDNSFEDVDHCVRVSKAGYRLRFLPDASVVHLAAVRSADVTTRHHESAQRRYYIARNGTYFFLKNYGWKWPFWRRSLSEARGLTAYAVKKPAAGAWRRWAATLAGYAAGCLAWLAHRVR